eukprot:UN29692
MYKSAQNDENSSCLMVKIRGLTFEGRLNIPGFHVREHDLALEAGDMRKKRPNVVLSDTTKENVYGLPFQADFKTLVCLEEVADKMDPFLEQWTALINTEPAIEEEGTVKKVDDTADTEENDQNQEAAQGNGNDEEVEQEEEEEEEEEEEDYDGVITFSNGARAKITDKLQAMCFNEHEKNYIAWSFSKSDASSTRPYLFSYVPSANPNFLRKIK